MMRGINTTVRRLREKSLKKSQRLVSKQMRIRFMRRYGSNPICAGE